MAIIVFLAHIGSFVPADAATVGLTDRYDFLVSQVFYEIGVHLCMFSNYNLSFFFLKKKKAISLIMLTDFFGDQNCRIFCATGSRLMTAEQSTFMIDLHQIGMMLRYAEKKTDKHSCNTLN